MDDRVVYQPGSIGASNTDLAHYILDSSEMLKLTYMQLYGFSKKFTVGSDGKPVEQWEKIEGQMYTDKCLAWLDSKLLQAVNKNQFLSRYNTEAEMNKEARFMMIGFLSELYLNLNEFAIKDAEKAERLRQLFSNFTAQAIRHPLYESTKNMLAKTTSEQKQTVLQDISQREQRTGLIGSLLGAKP